MEVVVTTGAIRRAKLQSYRHISTTNQHPIFYTAAVLPVAQPTVSEHWRDRTHRWCVSRVTFQRLQWNSYKCHITVLFRRNSSIGDIEFEGRLDSWTSWTASLSVRRSRATGITAAICQSVFVRNADRQSYAQTHTYTRLTQQETQLSLTNRATHLEVSQGHQTIRYVTYGFLL